MAKYPNYPTFPMFGKLQPISSLPARDLFPTSGTAPRFANALQHGRYLAGIGADETAADAGAAASTAILALPAASAASNEAANTAAPKIVPDSREVARSELRRIENEDDTDGNGIFDGLDRKPNVYPDAGVFASNWGLPGYIRREKMFAASEVIDATTGRPTVYVPAGAVSIDDAAKIAYLEGRTYIPLRSTIPMPQSLPTVSTADVATSKSAIGEITPAAKVGLGVVALALGLGVGFWVARRK